MTLEQRHIELLSLRTARTADIHPARQAMLEGLRLATLPGEGQPGTLLVRRVHLNTIDLARGAYPIAARLGEQLRELRRRAIFIGDERAAKADAVIVSDRLDPYVVALVRAGSGAALHEWFWPHLEPRWSKAPSPAAVIEAIWMTLTERADAARFVPAVVAELLDRQVPVHVFSTLAPQLALLLQESLKLPPLVPRLDRLLGLLPVTWRAQVGRAFAASRGPASAWIGLASVRAVYPRLSVDGLLRLLDAPRNLVHPEELVANEVPDVLVSDRAGVAPSSNETVNQLTEAQAASVAGAHPTSAHAATHPVRLVPHGEVESMSPAVVPPAVVAQREPGPVPSLHPRATEFGGLFFLLQPLARLGFGAFLVSHPVLGDLDLGLSVLRAFAAQLAIPETDPVWEPLRLERNGLDRSCESIPEPPEWVGLWTDTVPCPPFDCAQGFDGLIALWCAATCAWLARHAGLELRQLVQRDGAVACTRTHVDVVFELEASDVNVRRAALDVNPGWVPWLGRVVEFHYVRGGVFGG